MSLPIVIIGESGTGKTSSLRNFKPDEISYVNVAGKPLPFRGKFEESIHSEDYTEIKKFIEGTKKDIIVIDDSQYIMGFSFMRRVKETGWDKFNEIQSDMFNLIDLAGKLAENKRVYFLTHLETKEDGRQKMKTIGKMLDEKITLEGMFSVVLKTLVSDGKYLFATQNSGNDTVKSPIGMFGTFAIENDLKYVDDKIQNYYGMKGAKTDEEMKAEDETAERREVEKGGNGRIKRASRAKEEGETKEETIPTVRVPRRRPAEGAVESCGEAPVQQDVDAEPTKAENASEAPKRRTRKVRNEPVVEIEDISDEDTPF